MADIEAIFREMAHNDYVLTSPIYERLGRGIAERPDLAEPLLAAPETQRIPLLYFAAIGHVLRTSAAGHPLSQWYPTLGGDRPAADGDPVAALADLVGACRDEITTLCATRRTQTNEAGRATLLRPAFGRAAELAGDRRLALIELGTSAGLLLVPDRYRYTYTKADGSERSYGDGALTLATELRSAAWPEPAAHPLAIAARTGIDLSPIRPDDLDAVAWLRACIWPEHVARVARLDAALAEVAEAAPTLVAGDFVEALPGVLASVADDVVPVVFASHAITYLSPDARRAFASLVHTVGYTRDLVLIVNEGAPNLFRTFAPSAPETTVGVRTDVAVISFIGGTASVEVMLEGAAHGAWVDFRPRVYPYEYAG